MAGSQDPTAATLLAGVQAALAKQRRKRVPQLYLEGLAFTAIALAICLLFRIADSGMVSMFLASAGLAGRLDSLLRENRDDIWVRKIGAWPANRKTSFAVLALFAGMLTAYVAATALLGETGARRGFRFALEAAGLGNETILDRRFGDPAGLIAHNLGVLAMFFLLAFVYRGLGALLALSWNACIWGFVSTTLVARGAALGPGSAVQFVLLAAAGLLPHLMLEALAYVLAALAGIYVSKAILKYDLGEVRFQLVLRASIVILGGALLALGAAAVLESSMMPLFVARLKAVITGENRQERPDLAGSRGGPRSHGRGIGEAAPIIPRP